MLNLAAAARVLDRVGILRQALDRHASLPRRCQDTSSNVSTKSARKMSCVGPAPKASTMVSLPLSLLADTCGWQTQSRRRQKELNLNFLAGNRSSGRVIVRKNPYGFSMFSVLLGARGMKLLLLLLCVAAVVSPARALESAAVSSPRAAVTLVTNTDHAASGQSFKAALRLRLAPGWHTYWQNPGDAGVAPELSFDPAGGMVAGPIDWPAPERVSEGPLTTFAYEGDVLLPVSITPNAAPTALRAHASWLVCKNVCVPEEGEVSLDVPAGPPTPSAEAPLFAAALARTPVASPYARAHRPRWQADAGRWPAARGVGAPSRLPAPRPRDRLWGSAATIGRRRKPEP